MVGENRLKDLQNQMGSLTTKNYDRLLLLRRERLAEFIRFKTENYQGMSHELQVKTHKEARSYPVVSIVSPVLTTHENKIEFPGDPMCLYNALAYPIKQVVMTGNAIALGLDGFPSKMIGEYNDVCPDWFNLPTKEYRASVCADIGGRRIFLRDGLNTDQYVFDPRVWNPDIASRLKEILTILEPRVVLISSVSPAHRYAIEIAKLVKNVDENAVVMLGGRHADETIRFVDGSVEYAPSSIVSAMLNGKAPPVVDFVVSGEGYYALDYLMKCTSISMDVETKRTTPKKAIEAVKQNADELASLPGNSLITYLEDGQHPVSIAINGRKTDISELPIPYEPFAIRAHFPIFVSKDGKKRSVTAHVNTAHACPFFCSFCSESTGVVGKIVGTKAQDHYEKIIRSYVEWGADALFFDDSVLCGGDGKKIRMLVHAMKKIREDASEKLKRMGKSHPDYGTTLRMANFEWGAQFTVDYLVSINSTEQSLKLLSEISSVGCTYIYVGIESLADEVANEIDKNKKRTGERWVDKTRRALEIAKSAGIRVGASVLFGLPGETDATVDSTIEETGKLVDDGLLFIVSPNIATYHPATPLTRMDGMVGKIDYISATAETVPPYTFFEEAFKGVVSKRLSEDIIWHIHGKTAERWKGARNYNPMEAGILPDVDQMANTEKNELPASPRGEFYSGSGLRLIDSSNYPRQVTEFLEHEAQVVFTLLESDKYDCLVEVGAMDQGFFLESAMRSGKSYIGIDLVERLVMGLRDRISLIAGGTVSTGMRAEAHTGDVFDMPAIASRLGLEEGGVAAFPFNSFGNIPYPEGVVSKVHEAGMDIAIFTYATDEKTAAVRNEYYNKCDYRSTIMERTNKGVLFRSEDGLWSYAYDKNYLVGVLQNGGYRVEVLPFGEIGLAYIGKMKKGGE